MAPALLIGWGIYFLGGTMKILLAVAICLTTVCSFAASTNAVDKLTTYLPVGSYSGKTDQGRACSVSVNEVNYPDKDIQVRITEGKKDLTKLIAAGSEFSYKDYKKEFIQTERTLINDDDTTYVERIIRTVNAGDNKLYVVVSFNTVINTESDEQVAECVINL